MFQYNSIGLWRMGVTNEAKSGGFGIGMRGHQPKVQPGDQPKQAHPHCKPCHPTQHQDEQQWQTDQHVPPARQGIAGAMPPDLCQAGTCSIGVDQIVAATTIYARATTAISATRERSILRAGRDNRATRVRSATQPVFSLIGRVTELASRQIVH